MSDNPIIERMAAAHFEACANSLSSGRGRGAWSELTEEQRRIAYDAMWVALKELRVPSQEMVEASWKLTSRASAAVRMKMELAQPREAHKLKMAERFTAMIDSLLEIK